MEHYTMMMSRSHQKLADLAQVSGCLGSPQCSCSQCKLEAALGSLTMADFQALKSEPAKRLSQSPENIAYMGDGHRCKRFPCPICNPGRSQRDGLSSAVTAQMLDWYAQGAVPQHIRRHGHEQQATVIIFGDGGHTCRRIPCPICNNGRSRSAAALEVHVGC